MTHPSDADDSSTELPKTTWSAHPLPNLLLLGVGVVAIGIGIGYRDAMGMLLYIAAGLVLVAAGGLKLLRRPRLAVVDGDLALKGVRSVRFIPADDLVEVRVLRIPRLGLSQYLIRLEYRTEQSERELEILSRGDLGEDPFAVGTRLRDLGFPVRAADLEGRRRD